MINSVLEFNELMRSDTVKMYWTAFMDSLPEALIGINLDGIVIAWNRGAEKLFGFSSEEIAGKPMTLLFSSLHFLNSAEQLKRLLNGDHLHLREHYSRTKEEGTMPVFLTISAVKDIFGNVIGMAIFIEKAPAEKSSSLLRHGPHAQQEVIKMEAVLSLEEGLNSILKLDKLIDFVVDKTTSILNAERCSFMLLDEESQKLCIKGSKGIDERFISSSRIRLGDPVAGLVAQRGEPILVADIETDPLFRRANRYSFKSKSFIIAPIQRGSHLMGVLCVAEKMVSNAVFSELDLKILCLIARQVAVAIENARLYKELKYLSVKDTLTGLSNYRHFIRSLDDEIKRTKRYPNSLCLLMLDVDHFKPYNDLYGQGEGDQLLKTIGRILQQNLRDVDIPCRYAGDEFAVILPETKIDQAKRAAEKIKEKIEQLPHKCKVTISIGVAKFESSMDRYELIRKADSALYQAKQGRKATVCLA